MGALGKSAHNGIWAVAIVGSCVFGTAMARSYKYGYVSANYSSSGGGGTCLTTSMHMNITFYLAAPIPANANQYQIAPISWKASNGLHSYSSASKSAHMDYGLFSTDANGKIINWIVDFYASPQGALEYAGTRNDQQDQGAQNPCSNGVDETAYATPPQAWKQPRKQKTP